MRQKVKETIGWAALLLSGTYIMGIGTGISLESSLSGDAVSFLWDAMSQVCSISVETANLIFSAVLMLFVLKFDWKVLGIGTLVCPFIQNLGIVTVRNYLTVPVSVSACTDLLIGLTGIFLLSVGCGMFVCARKGTSVYLGFGQIISRRLHQNYGLTIMLTDSICFLLAAILLQKIAVGPLIAVAVSGPVIDGTIRVLDHFMKKEEKCKL